MNYFDEKAQRCMRRLAIVPRWQTAPAHRRQSVLEHSVGVLMIAGMLSDYLDVVFNFDDAMSCLQHDMDEAIHGDTPSTSKTRKKASDCHDVKYAIMKAADYLESCAWLCEETAMGNQRLITPGRDTFERKDEWLYRAFELANVCPDPEIPIDAAGSLPSVDDFMKKWADAYDVAAHPPMEYS